MQNLYVQYGCGLSAPNEWVNYDASPTLRLQRTPVVGALLKNKLNVLFPTGVQYGDIIKGLPVKDNSCAGIYCSHTLEHLSLEDLRTALTNTYKILQPGGLFRCVVPDLEIAARDYIASLTNGNKNASMDFMNSVLLGLPSRPKGIKGFMNSYFGNSHHLWMWDVHSLSEELKRAGFKNARPCAYHDSSDAMFRLVEDKDRFYHAAAIECSK